METRKLQFTREDLEDISFALIIAADESREMGHETLSCTLLKLQDRIKEYIDNH